MLEVYLYIDGFFSYITGGYMMPTYTIACPPNTCLFT